jgi:MscS family membrane protein
MNPLNYIIFENEVWRWAAYLGIALASIMLSKTIFYVFKFVIQQFTKRTKSIADDLVMDAVQRPVSLAILFSGIFFGLYLLSHEGLPIAKYEIGQNIYLSILSLLGIYVIARLYGDLLMHYLKPIVEKTETKLDDQLLPIAIKGGRFVIWAIGFMIAASTVGIDVSSLIAGLGIGGLALAMAAKDTVANVFGGASIFADKPFQMGDLITVKGHTGRVEEIGIRTTRIRTYEDTIFMLPNAVVADSPIENLSARRKRKRNFTIGLTYDTTYEQMQEAKKLVHEILKEVGGLEDDPVVRFDEFGDFALVLRIVYWVTDPSEYFDKLVQVNELILKKFPAAGLDMAFPTQTVIVQKEA